MSRDKAKYLSHPLNLDLKNIYNPPLNYSNFMIPGLVFAILQQILLICLCMRIGKRPEAFFGSKTQVKFYAHFLPYVLISTLFALVFACLILPLFHLPFYLEHLPALFILSFFFAVATASCAILISSFSRDRLNILIALMFYSIPAIFMSGYSWPTQYLPFDLKILSNIFPITHFLQEIRKVILGPIGLESYLHALLVLGVFSVTCLSLHSVILKLKDKN
jgi:ABC-2 type transport system permease protein